MENDHVLNLLVASSANQNFRLRLRCISGGYKSGEQIGAFSYPWALSGK